MALDISHNLKIAEDIGEIKGRINGFDAKFEYIMDSLKSLKEDMALKGDSVIITQGEHAKDIKNLMGWKNKIIGAVILLQSLWGLMLLYFNNDKGR